MDCSLARATRHGPAAALTAGMLPTPAPPLPARAPIGAPPKAPRSPLRYPGGKTRAIDIILPLIPVATRELVSPFFGGGSVELTASARGIRVFGYDLFAPLVAFWQCALRDPQRLAQLVHDEYYPLTTERFYALQRQPYHPSAWHRAARFFAINRASFSGSTLSGGMSPGHARYNEAAIERLAQLVAPGVSVARASFEDSLVAHPHALAFVDPPYLLANSTLYGKNGSTHRDFDHAKLARLLADRRSPWILTYNDHPEIRALYAGFAMFTPRWSYGMSRDKRSRELFIVSPDLAHLVPRQS